MRKIGRGVLQDFTGDRRGVGIYDLRGRGGQTSGRVVLLA